MQEHPKHTLRTFWNAETAGHEAEAERALFTLFKSLPEAIPPADFADRVLARAGIGVAVARRTATHLNWRVRLAIAASLFLAGLAAAFLLPAVIGLSQLVSAGEVMAILVQGFSTGLQWFAGLASVWGFFSQLSESLVLVVTTPPVALVLVIWSLLASFAYRGLTELLSPRRSAPHVYV